MGRRARELRADRLILVDTPSIRSSPSRAPAQALQSRGRSPARQTPTTSLAPDTSTRAEWAPRSGHGSTLLHRDDKIYADAQRTEPGSVAPHVKQRSSLLPGFAKHSQE